MRGPQTWPDITLLVRDWLASELSGPQVGTKVPLGGGSSVRVQRVGGPRTQVLDMARVLVEIRDVDEASCTALAGDVRDLMRRIPGAHALGVVSGCTEIGGLAYLPDPVTAQPRITVTFMVHVKPQDV